MPHLATPNTNPPTANNVTSTTNNLKQPPIYTFDASKSPDTLHDTAPAPHSPRPPIKKVHIADQNMHDDVSHKVPSSSGHTHHLNKPEEDSPETERHHTSLHYIPPHAPTLITQTTFPSPKTYHPPPLARMLMGASRRSHPNQIPRPMPQCSSYIYYYLY
jgi:hypothetical protein